MSSEAELDLLQYAGEINEITSERTGARQEGKVLTILRSLNPQALAGTLDSVEIPRLLASLDDRFWGPDSRRELLRLLVPAVEFLAIETKADLISSLARGRTDLRDEQTIARLFLSETGERLTRLKLDVDQARDGHDLLHILYHDIDSADLRFDLIHHFQTQSLSGPLRHSAGLRVVSDIDDTIFSSLHDSRFKRGTIYPGVLELLSELSPYAPVFLTARPELANSLFERVTHRQLTRYGLEGCTVLSGRLPGLLGHRRMAEQKARTLTQYCELYPEFRFIFIGDSGQGDMALSLSLLGRKPSPIERAFIHKLADHHPGSVSNHPAIQTFDSYAHAATLLSEHGYLSAEQVALIHSAEKGLHSP